MPPNSNVFFLDLSIKTKPKIKIKAPKEQTLNPSKNPKIIAKTGKEYLPGSISPIIGMLIFSSTVSDKSSVSSSGPASLQAIIQLSICSATESLKPIKYSFSVNMAGTFPNDSGGTLYFS